MPKPETHADHIPFRTCIRLEDVSQARTSSIDAEWESLSLAKAQERTLPTASARPRFETLPGIGPETRPRAEPKPRGSRGRPLQLLAATLSLSLALVAALAGPIDPGIFSARSPVLSVQSKFVASATSEPSVSPISAPALPLAVARVSAAEPPLTASQSEPPRAKPMRRRKPVLRPTEPDRAWPRTTPGPVRARPTLTAFAKRLLRPTTPIDRDSGCSWTFTVE